MATKEIFVDPSVTTLSDLLDIAAGTPSGIITIRGEKENSNVEWGVAVIIGPVASEAIDIIDTWAEAVVANAEDQNLPDILPSTRTLINEPN